MTELEQVVHDILENLAKVQRDLPKVLSLANRREPKRSYSVSETAEIIGRSETTVYRLIEKGVLDAFVPNGMENGLRVKADSLGRWIEDNM